MDIQHIRNHIRCIAQEKGELWFWETHIEHVERYALWLMDRIPNANQEVVLLSVWLHDIIDIVNPEKRHEHAKYGAEFAEVFLTEQGITSEIIVQVAHSIRCHSCKDELPQTVEGKILATADAMSHMDPEFYLGIALYDYDKGVNEFADFMCRKLDKHLQGRKIFFDFAQTTMQERYEKIKAFVDLMNKTPY